jgi:hypothetical protein
MQRVAWPVAWANGFNLQWLQRALRFCFCSAMPQPEQRPAFVIADDLGQARIWELIDAGVTVMVGCDACHHTARWSPAFMDQRLSRLKAAKLMTVAVKVRCGRCRSCYVRLWRG